jgi:hypothetical protein
MSFDLYFCRRNSLELPFDEVADWSRQYTSFSRSSDSQLFYQNECTGVYFSLDHNGPHDSNDLGLPSGVFDTGWSLNLNYVRPTFFALEAMPIAEALARRFDLVMFDPQGGDNIDNFGVDQLIQSWSKSNQWAVGEVATKDSLDLFYLPAQTSEQFWRYMRDYPRLRGELEGPDVFVPRQFLASIHNPQRAETALVWTLGVHLIIPRTDWIIAVLPKKVWQKQNEMVCYRSDVLLAPLSQYLREFDADKGIKILPPENVTLADKVLKGLAGGVDFGEVKKISPDACVDVPFGRFKPI